MITKDGRVPIESTAYRTHKILGGGEAHTYIVMLQRQIDALNRRLMQLESKMNEHEDDSK